ncbi:MAG: DUF3018 family protein [Hyphomicrobiaceae bacterium]|nr:MAG: DUF3018 family protein [Hyphomicrobiaceae bacterium]
MAKSNRAAARYKMSAYRARLREAGLRPIQVWVPDTRSAALAQAARRQSRLASRRKSEQEALDFIEESVDLGKGT